ncbi:NACHT, LRR and PYD domains-containing protein 4 [Perognathus longimembris pacificus]|uniref:NACHT, LRR and PYD domains-containing protein 4 n=1 Tax=Perognathus longimembris pacificus TaxID=214514 RepID=UPI002019883D|nr:NACHT, LRR and PYD domains-containing protein 4 [Perognathus longimembris pacificus]
MASSFFFDFGLMWYLEELSKKELVKFKELLKQETEELGLKQIPWSEVKRASRQRLANLLTKYYEGPQAWNVTCRIFHKINRRDLCEKALRECTGHTTKYRAHIKEKLSYRWRREAITEVAEVFHQKITREEREYFDLLLKPTATEEHSRTVVIKGIPGIGKTILLMKLTLAWSGGLLGQDQFSYVFYFCCRELKKLPATSLADLICREWYQSSLPSMEITAQPERILFIIDSLEKLNCDLDQPESELCSDWTEQKPVHILVNSLLRKKMFPQSSLIIATTHDLSEELEEKLKGLQVRSVLGFDDQSKKLYFSSLFSNWWQAMQAFNMVQENEQISHLCEVPLLCWLVCTCLKQEMERGRELADACRCTTALYTTFIFQVFTPKGTHRPSWQGLAQLQGLCALAVEGMWTNTFVFPEDMLWRNGIAVPDIPTLLEAKLLLRDKELEDYYTFFHLSVQEFCAALFYVLKDPSEHPHPAVARVEELLMTYLKGNKKTWIFLGCFLVGLLHEKEQEKLHAFFGFQYCQEVKQRCQQCLRKVSEDEDLQSQMDFLKLAYCLFEMQNDIFARQVLEPFKEVDCLIEDNLDLTVSSYCLKFCSSLKNFCLSIQDIWGKKQNRPVYKSSLGCWYQICSVLAKNACLYNFQMKDSILSESAYVALYGHLKQPTCLLETLEMKGVDLRFETHLFFEIFVSNPNLKYLSISSTELSSKDVQLFCEALNHPTCNIEKLYLEDCNLSSFDCNALAPVLIRKKLTHLSLTCNYLEAGVNPLCATLCRPEVILCYLGLSGCYLSEQCCPSLSEVLMNSKTLSYLDLSLNNLKDEGLEILCEALRLPQCMLRTLCIMECGLSAHGCRYLVPVLTHSQHLRNLQMGGNDVGDAGAKLLFEALTHPSSSLKNLGLHGCELTSACCEDLYSALTHSKKLEELNLIANNLDSIGVTLLCEALNHPECPLRVLWMNKDDLDEESQVLLWTEAERNPELAIKNCLKRKML